MLIRASLGGVLYFLSFPPFDFWFLIFPALYFFYYSLLKIFESRNIDTWYSITYIQVPISKCYCGIHSHIAVSDKDRPTLMYLIRAYYRGGGGDNVGYIGN